MIPMTLKRESKAMFIHWLLYYKVWLFWDFVFIFSVLLMVPIIYHPLLNTFFIFFLSYMSFFFLTFSTQFCWTQLLSTPRGVRVANRGCPDLDISTANFPSPVHYLREVEETTQSRSGKPSFYYSRQMEHQMINDDSPLGINVRSHVVRRNLPIYSLISGKSYRS